MNPITRQLLSAISVASVGYVGGIVMSYPGIVLAQWDQPDSTVHLSITEASWFASIYQLTCIPGSIIGGILIEKMGPRRLILCFLPLLALSWAVINYTVHIPILLIFTRVLQGLTASVLIVAGCLYPCEIADVSRRGFLGSIADAMFSLGFLATYLVGSLASWQYFGYITIIIAIVPCCIGTWFAPESALWLVRRGRLDEAVVEMKKIRSEDDNVEEELLMAAKRAAEETKISMMKRMSLLIKLRYLLPVVSVVLLLMLKEATGQFAVVLFAVQIFRRSDSGLSAYWSSIIASSVRLVCNILCCLMLEKLPRKVLIGIPALVGAVSMASLSIYFYSDSKGTVENMDWIPLVFVMLFVVSYGIGMGPVSWLLAAELMPRSVCNIGSGLGQAGFNSVQWLVASTFVQAESTFQLSICFIMYTIGCLAFGLFILLALPETRGKSLMQIEDIWIKHEKKLLRLAGKKEFDCFSIDSPRHEKKPTTFTDITEEPSQSKSSPAISPC